MGKGEYCRLVAQRCQRVFLSMGAGEKWQAPNGHGSWG